MPSMLALLYSSILAAATLVGWNWVLGNIEASIASTSLIRHDRSDHILRLIMENGQNGLIGLEGIMEEVVE